jgi:MoaA/NifB/PqqE/SkfB family radical SAM enzyme
MLDLTDPLTLAHIRADQTLTPLSALVEITHACNVDCEHCYLDLVPDKKIGVLSLDEWKRILKELKDAGTLYLTISGGEILVRRDWFEIASHARRLGFALKLFTNGTLIDDDAAGRQSDLRSAEPAAGNSV